MVRISKQSEKRGQSHRKRHYKISKKTGPLPSKGLKTHINAINSSEIVAFIPKL